MKLLFRLALYLSLGLATPAIHAANFAELVEEANQLDLAREALWLKLLHYEEASDSQSQFRSAIHSPEFFLSEEGQTQPADELEATLKEVLREPERGVEKHAQCRFPARFIWLKSQLHDLDSNSPRVPCPEFQTWRREGNINSISVIYATGFLGNPASYYGHLLLKFNSDLAAQSDLLNLSVNYGAIVPDGEDPFTYMIKGLIGGYDGGFTHINYYFHNHNYGELELRDLWEYKLQLPEKDVELIVAHAWEILRMRYTYYFLGKNCGFRVAELLELVDGIKIIPENIPWKVPQTLIANLNDQTIGTSTVVSDITYHPSRQSRLYEKHAKLNRSGQKLAQQVVKNPTILESVEFQEREETEQVRIVEYLMDYYQFLKVSDADRYQSFASGHKEVLARRFQLPPAANSAQSSAPDSPHIDRDPSYVAVSGFSGNSARQAQVHIRPAYYDGLDGGLGHMKHSTLSMMDTRISVRKDQARLEELSLMRVENIGRAITNLPSDRGESWRLDMGIAQEDLECNNCLTPRASAHYGYVKPIHQEWVAGLLLGGIVKARNSEYAHLQASSYGFLQGKITEKLSARIQFEARYHTHGQLGSQYISQATLRYKLSKNWDLRFGANKDGSEDFSISLGHYW